MEYISTAEDLVWLLSAGGGGECGAWGQGAGRVGGSAPQGEAGPPTLEHLPGHLWQQFRGPGSCPVSFMPLYPPGPSTCQAAPGPRAESSPVPREFGESSTDT